MVAVLFIVRELYKNFDQSATDVGLAIFAIIFFLSILAVKVNSVINKLITFLVAVVLVVFMGRFFLNSDISFPDISLFVIALSIIFVSLIVLIKVIEDTKIIKTGVSRISNVSELIKISLKSNAFNLLLVLMLWLLFFTAISAIMGIFGIGIVLFFIDAFVVSSSLIFIGMMLVTRKIKKNKLPTLLFAIITIVSTPLCIIIFYRIIFFFK